MIVKLKIVKIKHLIPSVKNVILILILLMILYFQYVKNVVLKKKENFQFVMNAEIK